MAVKNPLYLVLDQGGHASRAMVFNMQGEKLSDASQAIDTYRYEERVELDSSELVESLKSVALKAYHQLGEERYQLVAAGLATQRSNMLCWRRSDSQALSPVLSWQDRRAADKLNDIDHQLIKDKTGLFANAHYGASKMAWCLENIDEVKLAASQNDLVIGPMASYLASQLTGDNASADPANASRTLLWNIHTRDWDDDLCHLFGINLSWLPPCVPSDHNFGMLSLAGQKIPLSIVTGDLSAAAFVNGEPAEDIAYITLGTGGFVQRIAQRSCSHPRLLDGMLWQSTTRQFISLEGTVNGAGSAISWLAAQHHIDESEIISNLSQWYDDVQAPPFFLNAVSGIGSPFWCGDEIPKFDREAALAEQAAAILDSILFLLMLNMTKIDEVLPKASNINLSGGLASIDGLCQRLADLTGLPVQRNNETEATARGLAYLLAGFNAEWPVSYDRFEPKSNDHMKQKYNNWLQFLRNNLSDRCLYFEVIRIINGV